MAKPVTLITGASAGIGAALARVFAAHGHQLVLVARRRPALDLVADGIAAAGHGRPQVMPIDLAQNDAPARLAADLAALGLEPEAVVNNAGFGLSGEAAALDLAEQLAMIDLNVRALTDLSLRWLDSLARHRGGVLNVASIAAFMPGPGMAVYHATKAFILSFSEALHREVAQQRVRVTVLCPGPVDTDFQARAGLAADRFPRQLVRASGRVAADGYDGFAKGRRLVVPGFANQVATLLPRVLSRERVLSLSRAK
ncbi:MAG: SDR family NAD(P)-dependent oxidoreductase [Xanthobacteraceae bacterium]